jgi:hypothetical protein
MKDFLSLAYIFLLLITLSACKKSSTTEPEPPAADTVKPVVSLIDPALGKSVVLGSPLHLQMDLSDNTELKSYKVTIAKSLKGLETADWAFTQTWSVASGKKTLAVNHNEISVPTTVAGKQTTTGNYEMTVLCSDVAGNEASTSVTISLIK